MNPSPLAAPPRAAFVVAAMIVAAVAMISFAPVLDNGFVSMDDRANFLDNYDYRGLGLDQILTAFTQPRLGVYQPVASLALSLQYQVFGLDPWGYHATSLVLHAINAVLLLTVLVAIFSRSKPATTSILFLCALVAALFAAHPLRVETVAWATAQLYLVGGMFSLLAVGAYLRANPADSEPRHGWRWAAWGLALTSMLAMPGAVVLPVIFLCLDLAVLGRLDRSRMWAVLVEKAPALAMSVVVALLAVWAKQHDGMIADAEGDVVWAKLAQAASGIALTVSHTLAPLGVSPFYPRPEGGNFATIGYAVVVTAVLAGLGLVAWFGRWRPAVLALAGAALALIAPHLGLARVGNTLTADRYTYAASMVLGVGLVAALGRGMRSPRTRVAILGFGTVLVVGLSIASRSISTSWHDSETLWRRALTLAPGSPEAHLGLGTAFDEQGRTAEALAQYDEALRLRPEWATALLAQGAYMARVGRFAEAVDLDRRALIARPGFPAAMLNLGLALDATHRPNEALRQFEAILRIDPEHAEALSQVGRRQLDQGQFEKAATTLQIGVGAHPHHAELRAGLGVALLGLNRIEESARQFRQVLADHPDHVPARINLGIALAQIGQLDHAVEVLKTAVQTDPDDSQARFTLGAILAQAGRFPESREQLLQALAIRPQFPQAQAMLAQVEQQTLRR